MQTEDYFNFTGATTSAGFAAGTTTTYTNTNNINFGVNGFGYVKASGSNLTQPTTDLLTGVAFVTVPLSSGCTFLYMLNAAGTIFVAQSALSTIPSSVTDGGAATAIFEVAPRWPRVPEGYAPYAWLTVKVGSSGTAWLLGTSNSASVSNVGYARGNIIGMGSPRPLNV